MGGMMKYFILLTIVLAGCATAGEKEFYRHQNCVSRCMGRIGLSTTAGQQMSASEWCSYGCSRGE